MDSEHVTYSRIDKKRFLGRMTIISVSMRTMNQDAASSESAVIKYLIVWYA